MHRSSLLLAKLAAMNFQARQKNLREHLATSRFDGLLVSHLPNIRYLCGFTGSAGLLLVQESGSVFITDVRYDTQAHDEVKGAKVVIAWKALLEALGEVLAQRKAARRKRAIAIESEHLSVAEKKRLIKFRPASITLKDASAIVEKARMLKDDEELQLIRAAVALGARLFDRAVEVMGPGTTEVEVAADTIGVQLKALKVTTEADFSTAFGSLEKLKAGAIVVQTDPFIDARRDELLLQVAHREMREVEACRAEAVDVRGGGDRLDRLRHDR